VRTVMVFHRWLVAGAVAAAVMASSVGSYAQMSEILKLQDEVNARIHKEALAHMQAARLAVGTVTVHSLNRYSLECESRYSVLSKPLEEVAAKAQAALNSGNQVEAVCWSRVLGDQGSVAAQYWLGLTYEFGHGVPSDLAEALSWYIKAQRTLSNGQEDFRPTIAKLALKILATPEQMTPAAACLIYSGSDDTVVGNGIPRDYMRAREYCLQAAQDQNADAQCALGFMFEFAQGGEPREHEKAAYWLQAGAAQGDSCSETNLAALYSHGFGVRYDPEEANRLVRIALAKGWRQANGYYVFWNKTLQDYVGTAALFLGALAFVNFAGRLGLATGAATTTESGVTAAILGSRSRLLAAEEASQAETLNRLLTEQHLWLTTPENFMK
jgi:TPR repeat protein